MLASCACTASSIAEDDKTAYVWKMWEFSQGHARGKNVDVKCINAKHYCGDMAVWAYVLLWLDCQASQDK